MCFMFIDIWIVTYGVYVDLLREQNNLRTKIHEWLNYLKLRNSQCCFVRQKVRIFSHLLDFCCLVFHFYLCKLVLYPARRQQQHTPMTRSARKLKCIQRREMWNFFSGNFFTMIQHQLYRLTVHYFIFLLVFCKVIMH